MCTVTVHHAGDSLLVTMNRDEARDRGPERPPEIHRGEVSWLAPADSERGGTWMAINELGVVACMMNAYIPGESPAALGNATRLSRGMIVPWIMVRGGLDGVRAALERDFDPSPYPPFTALLAHCDGVDSFTWDGDGAWEHTVKRDEWAHFTSSSWNTDEVIAWRARVFEEWLRTGHAMHGPLPSFHLLCKPEMREWSPWMDREHTCTRSVTQILKTGNEAMMRYWTRAAIDADIGPNVCALPLRTAREFARHD